MRNEGSMKQNELLVELNAILSERRNSETMNIDLLSTDEILSKINDEDHKVAEAVKVAIPDITLAVDNIVSAFNDGGRLIYLGAGTSGRLGILDAVECVPTFSVPETMVVGIIAGGETAIRSAVEGAEDDQEAAVADLQAIGFSTKDILVGIAASGRTPYVLSGLRYARAMKAKTVSVSCNPDSPIGEQVDVNICAAVGPEILTGSTRMKSGTAQKIILNMLSTASMIRIGKTYQNLMVDVKASNKKLYARAINIVIQATGCNEAQAVEALDEANFETKVAILMILADLSAVEAQQILQQNNGFLRNAVDMKGK
ncbi:putative PTS component; possibly regulatory [Alteromonas sp. 38]|nr:putative PTS component; possibly regulatory [Alteromonas sp. 154]VXB39730.1 putative PTS component; possibly regulatory [Alteromonas sp. 38]